MRKKKKYLILGILVMILSGGTIIGLQHPNLFSKKIYPTKHVSSKGQQLEEVKKHGKEIEDFVKSQNPKIESVQIAWDETKWEKVGNGTPQGGGEIVNVYGSFNHIESSSWNVTFDIENDKIIPNSMALANYLRVEGRVFD
ncbi:MAG: hypothetical protein E6259_06095 [Streptococcus sp.]|nr:hypothetical protein [Streptococcus sp.]